MNEFKSGYIHTDVVNGPGIRVSIFMQGCPLRCLFCHNPDTWVPKSENKMSSKEVVDLVRKYRPYIEQGGGVTFSGGEPLFQSAFLLDMLKLCKKAGINTCIDTSGTGYNKKYLDEILKYTDLVILDIKAIDKIGYKKMTSKSIDMFNYFKERLNISGKKVWLRQVIVPTINDNIEYINNLKEYVKDIKNVERIDLLPYHDMAKDKYKKLKIRYKLKDIPNMDKSITDEWEKLLNE